MKQPILLLFLIVSATLCGFIDNASAQSYAIPRSVLGSGGIEISGASNRIIGTVGQTIIGTTQNSSNKGYLGFWYTKDLKPTPVEKQSAAKDFYLAQSYPNPLVLSSNNSAMLEYSLGRSKDVDLSIYDQMGRKIAILAQGMQGAGRYIVPFTPDIHLAAGIYHAVLKTSVANNSVETESRVLVLIK